MCVSQHCFKGCSYSFDCILSFDVISCFEHFLSLLASLALGGGGGGGGGGGRQLICELNVLLLVLAVAIHVV